MNTARQFGCWVRNAALLARTYVGLVVVFVWLAFPLMGGQERGNRPNADKQQADSTAPINEQAQALQVHEADKATLTFKGHPREVVSVAFSPDGKRLASASWDQTVKVWDATSGQVTLTLKGHSGLLQSVAFSPDGKRLASASRDKTVMVWDATSGQATLALKHTSAALSVAFSPDGKRVAAGSGDWKVKVWDATSGQEMLMWKGHDHMVTSIAFSPDGKRLASASWDRTVKLWDVTPRP